LRAAGEGHPIAEEKGPELEKALLNVLAFETAGDSMGRRANAKRSSLQFLSQALTDEGHPGSRKIVARMLPKLAYSPKANARRTKARGASPKERNEKFDHIDAQSSQSKATGDPIISVDTKKRIDR
jgi:hypothetical protein